VELASLGSSLKFCPIAEGGADVYPRPAPTSEWGATAAHAVLAAAGGGVCDTRFKTPAQQPQGWAAASGLCRDGGPEPGLARDTGGRSAPCPRRLGLGLPAQTGGALR